MQVGSKQAPGGANREGGILSCCSKLMEHLTSFWYWLREGRGKRRQNMLGNQEQITQSL